jgi:hypothetical protein
MRTTQALLFVEVGLTIMPVAIQAVPTQATAASRCCVSGSPMTPVSSGPDGAILTTRAWSAVPAVV